MTAVYPSADSPSADSSRAPLSLPRRSSGLVWTSLALSAVLVVASVGFADSRRVLEQLRKVDTRWLGVAFSIGLLQLALLGLRWSRIASELGLRLGWLRATTEYALSLLGNQVLPSGVAGDGLRALRHAKSSGGTGLLPVLEALALDRISGQLALWLLVLLSAPLSVRAGIVDARVLGIAVATLVLAAGLLWVALVRVPRWGQRTSRVRAVARRAARCLLSARGISSYMPLSLLLVTLTVSQLYVAARAVGVVLPWSQLFWLGPLILVAASVPSFFGGWGIREGASALLFAAAGMPESTGVAVSMVYGTFALVISLPGLFVLLFDSERARQSTSPAWSNANGLSMGVGTLLALWLAYPPLLAFVSGLCFFILIAQARGHWTPRGTFGWSNTITTLRLLLTMGLLFGYAHQPGPLLAGVGVVVLLLGAAGGWVARRSRQSSDFSARFDVEADALLVLTLAVILFSRGIAGPWVILAGLWRYLYVLMPIWLPMPLGEAPRTRQGRSFYVLMLTCFIAALVVPPAFGALLALLGTVAISLSFLHSFWLRYAPARVA